ncbi:MAG: hypothetical protein IJD30_05880 [Clostridia bacterium]|nr:hypothetical protein [Clostridia bacterium]
MKGLSEINKKEIQSDFKKRFPEYSDGVRTFAVANDLTLFGNGFEGSEREYYSLPVSVRTYLSLVMCDDGKFSFQLSDSNNEYTSATDELTMFKEKDFEEEIFKTISHNRKSSNGAKMLFSFDVNTKSFMKSAACVKTAFSLIGDGKIDESVDDGECNWECLLRGRKNYLISQKGNYIPLDLSGYKIIFAITDFKKEKGSLIQRLNKIGNDIPEEGCFCDSTEKYIINELNRIKKLSEKPKTEEILQMLKQSGLEYCEVVQKNSEMLKKMMKAAYNSGLCSAAVPAIKYSSLVVFVKEEKTDEFISIFSESGQLASGSQISFCITQSENSGVEV